MYTYAYYLSVSTCLSAIIKYSIHPSKTHSPSRCGWGVALGCTIFYIFQSLI